MAAWHYCGNPHLGVGPCFGFVKEAQVKGDRPFGFRGLCHQQRQVGSAKQVERMCRRP
jgi:hypothetical protein